MNTNIYLSRFTDETVIPKPLMRGMIPLKDKRKLYEAPKPHYYYHTEYNLFPNDSEPVKTDIVTYGVAAKIYSDADSKVLKTWQDGDKTWVTWTHRLVLGIILGFQVTSWRPCWCTEQ